MAQPKHTTLNDRSEGFCLRTKTQTTLRVLKEDTIEASVKDLDVVFFLSK
jgi:hypothetical protein